MSPAPDMGVMPPGEGQGLSFRMNIQLFQHNLVERLLFLLGRFCAFVESVLLSLFCFTDVFAGTLCPSHITLIAVAL